MSEVSSLAELTSKAESMNQERSDAEPEVIVVGAGPAGLMTAIGLAQKGVKTLVLERKPREQLGRSLRISLEADVFPELGIKAPQPPEKINSPQAREFISPDNRHKLRVPNRGLVSIDLRKFLSRLADQAEQAGARLVFETAVTGPLIENRAVRGVVGAGADGKLLELFAPLCVDASGVAGALRHELTPEFGIEREITPREALNVWQQSHEINREMVMELLAKNRVRPQVNVCRVGFMGAHSLFSVFLDLEDDRVDVTVGLAHDSRLPPAKELVQDYLAAHHWIGEAISAGGGLIPVRRAFDCLVADGLALVGDAACQVLPLHASGVASALVAGKLLAEAAAQALERGGASRSALWPYNARYQRDRGLIQANSELFRGFLEDLPPSALSRLFASGIITEEGVEGSLEGLPLDLPRSAVAAAALRLLRKPGLIIALARLHRDIHRALELYLAYPEEWDPEEFSRWRERAARLFNR